MARDTLTRRCFLAPEVIQTSAMDCGPASLKCLLDGYGIAASYGRLREACQTTVDGTSLDTLEEVACQLGLDAEQLVAPRDHLLLPEAGLLPAIAVVVRPDGLTHFVVLWRRWGVWVQVMDPASGRRWIRHAPCLEQMFVHRMTVPEVQWSRHACSEAFLRPLRFRLGRIGVDPGPVLERAGAIQCGAGMAALDAAARFVEALSRSGAIGRGEGAQVLETLLSDGWSARLESTIPPEHWHARQQIGIDQKSIEIQGAILVHVRGRQPRGWGRHTLPPELAAVVAEPPARPLRAVLEILREDGLWNPLLLSVALAIAALATLVEAMILRGLVDLQWIVPPAARRLWLASAGVAFLAGVLGVEYGIAVGLRSMGRQLEGRFRVAFMSKLPRLGDRYFQSRPTSDMLARSHAIALLRAFPSLGGQMVRSVCEMAAVSGALIWLDRGSAPLVLTAAMASTLAPCLALRWLSEHEMRFRVHSGALARFYLDALRGLVAVRAHGAERSLRREHDALMVEWVRTGYRLARATVRVLVAEGAVGVAASVALMVRALQGRADAGNVLLSAYWSLALPMLGSRLASLMQQYPAHRNAVARVLEPLGAPDEDRSCSEDESRPERSVLDAASGRGVSIELRSVRVLVAGHVVLNRIDLKVAAGAHLAIVGPSGAGKSTLLGLLLGWCRAAEGEVQVDGELLDGARLAELRLQTAWVDPTVQLWNRSLLHNLCYGQRPEAPKGLGRVIEASELRPVVERLPGGLQADLGEAGGAVSGGEGQRVRLGRALLRENARLVLLDEPFRGMDRAQRRQLLERCRSQWRDATLLCVTHDIDHTRDFDRVVVMSGGAIAEAGRPTDLASRNRSRYRALLESEQRVSIDTWGDAGWRRVHLKRGRLETP